MLPQEQLTVCWRNTGGPIRACGYSRAGGVCGAAVVYCCSATVGRCPIVACGRELILSTITVSNRLSTGGGSTARSAGGDNASRDHSPVIVACDREVTLSTITAFSGITICSCRWAAACCTDGTYDRGAIPSSITTKKSGGGNIRRGSSDSGTHWHRSGTVVCSTIVNHSLVAANGQGVALGAIVANAGITIRSGRAARSADATDG